MIERILVAVLFLIGFGAVAGHPNIIKKIFGLSIVNTAVVILFVLEGSRIGESSPILGTGISDIVDPLPQALMLTAIVIGLCVTALALALAYRLYKVCGSFDITEISRQLKGDE